MHLAHAADLALGPALVDVSVGDDGVLLLLSGVSIVLLYPHKVGLGSIGEAGVGAAWHRWGRRGRIGAFLRQRQESSVMTMRKASRAKLESLKAHTEGELRA